MSLWHSKFTAQWPKLNHDVLKFELEKKLDINDNMSDWAEAGPAQSFPSVFPIQSHTFESVSLSYGGGQAASIMRTPGKEYPSLSPV